MKPHFKLETELKKQGYARVAGVDEAGRGPLAGPVVAAAVCLPSVWTIKGINDSKQLSAVRREALYEPILAAAEVGIGIASVDEIDMLNILQATFLAMRRALGQLKILPDAVLVDGNRAISQWKGFQKPVVRGDGISLSIAAASIIAKVTRDRLMRALDQHFPGYGFAVHKGYGTLMHRRSLAEQGPCTAHRRSFRIKALA